MARIIAARILISGYISRRSDPIILIESQDRGTQETAPKTVTYADAGVDLRSGDHAKERIKYLAQKDL